MVNKRIQDLLAAPSAPNATDIIEGERDPGGTPSSEKLTWTQIAGGPAFDDRFAPRYVTALTKTNNVYNLFVADHGKTAMYTNAGLVTVTLSPSMPVGSIYVLVSLGAGGLTVTLGAGVTYANGYTPKTTIARGESLYLEVTATNTYLVIGGTAA